MSYVFTYQSGSGDTILTGITLQPSFIDGGEITVPSIVVQIGNGTNPVIASDTLKFKIIISNSDSPYTISPNAFLDTKITQISFTSSPNKTIGDDAFSGSKLTEFKLYGNMISVGSRVCQNCKDLTTIYFDNVSSVTTIAERMFDGCDSLGEINIPNTVTDINQGAFANCDFDSLVFASGVTGLYIHDYAFQNSFIKQLNLPTRTTHIGNQAFSNCRGLISLELPAFISQCQFDTGVFSGCLALQSVKINTYIHDGVNEVDNATGVQTFSGCTLLNNVQFMGNVEYVSPNTFDGCALLDQMTFFNLVTPTIELAEQCFRGCGFVYLYLPKSVQTLGTGVFSNCTYLKQIVFDANTLAIDTNSVFSGCTALLEVILGPDFTSMSVGPSGAPSFTIYMYKQDAASLLQDTYQVYQGHVTVKPFHDRKFINHKSIYDSQHTVDYVMYTLPSALNKFNDCTFYFREASTTTSVIVITASNDGVMSNCVKMFSTAADVEGKTIQKIYSSGGLWYGQSTNGMQIPTSQITSDYILQNNFICEEPYPANQVPFTVDGSVLSTCDIFDLSNLTQNGIVNIENINRVKLTSNNNRNAENTLIKIYSLGTPIFEVQDIDSTSFTLEGDNCVLYLENTIKDRSTQWSIQAAKIIIHNLWIDYTVFQGQKDDGTILTKVECTGDLLIKFTANQVIQFQLIINKNDQIISEDTTAFNSVYYSSGWSSM